MRLTRLWWVLVPAVLAPAATAVWWGGLWPRRAAPLASDWAAAALVLAGDGVPGVRDGEAAQARFSDPFGVTVARDGTVYVADAGEAHRIRAIAPDGRVFTLAGGGDAGGGFQDGVGSFARFNTPSGLAIDAAGVLFVADTGNNAIRRVTPDGQVSTLAGDGTAGDEDGPARDARFNGPIGVALDAAGRVIVADSYNDRIRAITPDGQVVTIAGGGEPGAIDGTGVEARFHTPCGVAVDAQGLIYVADTGNSLIRTIDRAGNVTTPAWSWPDGLVRPIATAVGLGGRIYVTDDRGRILEIVPGRASADASGANRSEPPSAGALDAGAVGADGRASVGGAPAMTQAAASIPLAVARTVAGSTPGFRDGPGPDARFRGPSGLAVAAAGRLIVADAGNALVRLIAARSRLELRPPASPWIAPRFDVDRFGWQPLLWPVAPQSGPYEVAGTLGEARGVDAERFHAGVDVRIEQGTVVHAVRDGVVASPIANGELGSINEWLRIGPVGYVHVRAGRTRGDAVFDAGRFVPTYDLSGALIGLRVKRGARFMRGEAIATVNAFNHVHLNVGWAGEEYNPLRFHLTQFDDAVPPTIARGGVRVYDETGQHLVRRVKGRLLVSGRVQVVVDAWDQADGNHPGRRLGLYDLGYQVLTRAGSPAPGFETVRHTIRFDRIASSPEASRLVYAPGSGIPYYGGRRTRFLYIVTNTLQDGIATAGFWDTTTLQPGPYTLRAWAADMHGNAAVANRDLPVQIVPTE